MTGFNTTAENHFNMHESIPFGFPRNIDNAIIINYCILYSKYYIYVEEHKDKNNKSSF